MWHRYLHIAYRTASLTRHLDERFKLLGDRDLGDGVIGDRDLGGRAVGDRDLADGDRDLAAAEAEHAALTLLQQEVSDLL